MQTTDIRAIERFGRWPSWERDWANVGCDNRTEDAITAEDASAVTAISERAEDAQAGGAR